LNYTRNIQYPQEFTESQGTVSPPDGRGMVVLQGDWLFVPDTAAASPQSAGPVLSDLESARPD